MSLKKKTLAVLAAGAIVASAVPAMALENEFHGMFKFFGYGSNFFNGAGQGLSPTGKAGAFAEQRARIQYIAKANDDLKLVTHFELDSRFGGKNEATGYLGTSTGNDGGNLDADQLTLETKNVYLDFNCPITKANVKAGIQPWADSYKSLFLLADMTGVNVTKKFDPLTLSLAWFRFDDNTVSTTRDVGDLTADLWVADAKFAVNKDITLGASYYFIDNDSNTVTTPNSTGYTNYEKLHVVGANAAIKAGPLALDPFFAYQFGDARESTGHDISAFLAGATAKVKLGPGSLNATAIYLSGDDDTADTDVEGWRIVATGTTYFNPANMWLLVRSGQGINTSSSVLANDLTVGGRGLMLGTLGYEGTAGKIFYNANVGYAQVAEERGTEDEVIGTEVNAQVGYKLYDNLSISAAGAYAFLGDGMGGNAPELISGFGVADAEDPYMFNIQLAYAF